MAYDSLRGITTLFGGLTITGPSGDTWEWDGTTWVQRAVNGPTARYAHAMDFDTARGVTVLFGGINGPANAETWEWSGTIWTQRSISGPSARSGHAMAYDAARAETVLFGGFGNGDNWKLRALCYANCDGSTTPPVLNVLDFTCFLNKFAAGCS